MSFQFLQFLNKYDNHPELISLKHSILIHILASLYKFPWIPYLDSIQFPEKYLKHIPDISTDNIHRANILDLLLD